MGITYVNIDVGCPPEPTRWERIRFLVDSGALHSVVPSAVLEQLGIIALKTQVFQLADGREIVRRKGGAVFRLGDRIGVAEVVFGEGGDSNLLGAHTLEALGLGLNPLKRELLELPMLL